nr:retrovirus-related Pol polyprotein from transposon TNT 1-94 [Tanacetum cinerariifolium]
MDCRFARFNTIITSFKAVDEGFSSKNYVRKFLRALHPKWRAKVTIIEESKDLSSLALDELIDNLKVHEVVMEKDSKIYRGKKERIKYISLKSKKESSDDETLTSESDNEFKKFFRRKDEWIKDSGCSKHMTGNKSLFSTYKAYDRVPLPMSQSVIGTKWVSRNKLDKNGIVFRNKARLVAQGYNSQEGIDYYETYALVARLDSIRILLAISCSNDFKLYQMDVKSAFLNDLINEEVYVAQPLGFIDFQKSNYVYKHKKALYGLKQAPKAWYDGLKSFLIKHEYLMGMADNTLFTKKSKSHLIIVQIYVDDIIFDSLSLNLCDDFGKIMHDEFEMSTMGELNFLLGLQIKQMEDRIFFNQSKYINEMLKKFGLQDSKPTKTPMSTEIKLTKDDETDSLDSCKYQENPKRTHLEGVKRIFRYIRVVSHLGLWYPKGTEIETIVYADSDHAGGYVDRKSTSGVCTFMGCCLTSWFAKKQRTLLSP